MAEILAIVERILGLLSSLSGIIGAINGNTAKAAQENVPFEIATSTSITQEVVTDGSFGLAAIKGLIDAFQSDMDSQLFTIAAALATVQQTGVPVTLPTTPPPGYGGGSGTTAAEVWAYPSGLTGATANDRLDNASLNVVNLSTMNATVPIASNPYFGVRGPWFSDYGVNGPGSDPQFPCANMRVTDELGTFLERESGYTGWSRSSDGYYFINQDGSGSPFDYVCLLSTIEFDALNNTQFDEVLNQLPPVWPGDAFVTMLSTYTIADQMTVTEYCHGVLIDITDVTINKPSVPYDTGLAYKFIGGLAFFNEDGYIEPFQQLGFTKALYCPRQTASASGFVVRADPSVVGTIKTWKLLI